MINFDLSEQARAVLIGTICSIVLTPFVVALWQRFFPPRYQHRTLEIAAWQKNTTILQQSIVAGLCMPIMLATVFGPNRRLDLVGLGMVIGTMFAGNLAWVLVRTAARGTEGLREFGRFMEATYGIAFSSWLLVSGFAAAVGLACLVVFSLRQ